jgi:hypothetical protein
VEEVLAHHYNRRRKTMVYHVRFKGYYSLADKRLSAHDLRNILDLLQVYQVTNNL